MCEEYTGPDAVVDPQLRQLAEENKKLQGADPANASCRCSKKEG